MVGYVSGGTLRLVVIGLLSVTAISMGAATITSTIQYGQSPAEDLDPGIERNNTMGGQDRSGGGGMDLGSQDNATGASSSLSWCAPLLPSPIGALLYFGSIAGLLVVVKSRYSLGAAVFAGYGIAPVALIVYFLSTDCATFGSGETATGNFRRVVSNASSTQIAQPDVSPVWLIGVLGVVLVATAAVLVRASGDQTVDVTEEAEAEAEETDVADLAAAAGAAADRLEEHNADVDNEVYRAWWEMTRLLDVPNPDSSTPGEFADAAVELGMSRDDVGELTTLFEEVRYGKRDPESREDRAIQVFRNIEDEYGRDTGADLGDANETDSDADDAADTEDNDGH